MGIINWVQNRFNGKQEKRRSEAGSVSSTRDNVPVRESCRQDHAREEKNPGGDWPQSLLSIGTLGNEEVAPVPAEGGPRGSQATDMPDFTIEEVKKLQDALNKLLRRAKSKSSARGSAATDEDRASQLPLDRFLNCPSSLEVDRRISLRHAAADGENGEFSPNTQIILSKAKDLLVNSDGAAIKHKSFKFLLKKMFVCRGGFAPAPSLKDPVESRMEKLFRTMLQKKMSARPSNANAASSRKYYLEDKPSGRMQRDHDRLDDEDDKGSESIKWDKTDSDFIVLEI